MAVKLTKTEATLCSVVAMACSAVSYQASAYVMKFDCSIVAIISLRYFLAAGVLWSILRALHSGINWQNVKKHWWQFGVISGIMVLISQPSYFLAFRYTNAVDAGLISLLNPVATLLLGWFFLREKISIRSAVGMTIAMMGGVYVITGGNVFAIGEDRMLGNLLILISTIVLALSSVLTKKWISDSDAVSISTIIDTFAFFMIAIASGIFFPVWEGLPMNGEFWGVIIILGIIGIALQNVGWNIGILELGASKNAMSRTLLPIFIILISLLLGERISTVQWVALIVTLMGSALTLWPKSQKVNETVKE